MSDLSDYEKIRLENIRRNADFLNSLGFSEENKVVKKEEYKLPSKKRKVPTVSENLPRRRSLRIQQSEPDTNQEIDDDENKNESLDVIPFYEVIPFESKQLDNFEFQVYVKLREWRLAKSREEDLEAYKIFHNETLCEMIRRKRNNLNWGSALNNDGNEKSESAIAQELMECRGVGPSKSKLGGLARQMLAVIENDENFDLLRKSVEAEKVIVNS
jgi:superfamily II DNA helicase RecQ